MGREQNHINLRTEKEGLHVLKEQVKGFHIPSKEDKKHLYSICDIEYKRFSRSIDGVVLKVKSVSDVRSREDFLLIEVKTTKSKSVKKLPYGVFFGFTQNEEELFSTQSNYRLCIVHLILEEYCFLTFDEYKGLIQNKRIQYQINFRSED